jgi:AcrR family transcriptional regulator
MSLTRDEIVATAFRVWGAGFFQKTSLSEIAAGLGVTKPALYRHFSDKEALMKAMQDACFDRVSSFVRPFYDKYIIADPKNRFLKLALAAAEYFARYPLDFIFSMMQILGQDDQGHLWREAMEKRGISFEKIDGFSAGGGRQPLFSVWQMVMATMFFCVSQFHGNTVKDWCVNHGIKSLEELKKCLTESTDGLKIISEDDIKAFIEETSRVIQKGFGLDKKTVERVAYTELEREFDASGLLIVEAETGRHKILNAVGEAMAESGPWEMSMSLVAEKAGIAKSSLYVHFENRYQMIFAFLFSEFERIFTAAKTARLYGTTPEEELYVAIYAIASYLKTNPTILRVMDKFRTQHRDSFPQPEIKDMGKGKMESGFPGVHQIFAGIKLETSAGLREPTMRFTEAILFMLVNTLMQKPEGLDYADVPNENFRTLFRYLCLGLEIENEGEL